MAPGHYLNQVHLQPIRSRKRHFNEILFSYFLFKKICLKVSPFCSGFNVLISFNERGSPGSHVGPLTWASNYCIQSMAPDVMVNNPPLWHWIWLITCGVVQYGCQVDPSYKHIRSEQHGRQFADNIFKHIFIEEKFCNFIKIWSSFVMVHITIH